MVIYCDIDNTICTTNGMDYKNANPQISHIKKMNKLYDEDNIIVYWTARGVGSNSDIYDLTKKQLIKWGVKFHVLKTDKPLYDLFIDDKALSSKEFFK